MTRVFVRHNVADYKVWRKAYDDFDAERKRWVLLVTRFFNLSTIPMT